jgi:hypothetical protein
MSTLEK